MVNYMPEVAKMLGVELGERFKIVHVGSNKPISEFNYYFTYKDIEIDAEGRACPSEYLLTHLIYGDYTIKREPWKPAYDEPYWCVECNGVIYKAIWVNFSVDMMYYKLGNCYRTKQEAEANRDKWIAFYASDEVLEV